MSIHNTPQDLPPGNKKGGLPGWLKKCWQWLTGGPKQKPDEPKPVPLPETDINLNKPHDDFDRDIRRFDNELMIPELQENFMTTKRLMYECGWRDGGLGIKTENIMTIAHTYAQSLFDQAMVLLKSKHAALKTELKKQEIIEEREEINDKEQHEYKNYLQHGYRYFPRHFSGMLIFLYFLCFLVLLIADIPLALRLIMSGFNLESDGKLSLLFLGDTIEILKANWEVLFTAIGITTCTVYIKIFYDEFIGTSFGNKFVSRKKFIDQFYGKKATTQNGLSATEMEHIDKEASAKRKWKYGIAIFTVATLLVLAMFRVHTLSFFTVDSAGKQILTSVPTGWPLNLAIVAITLIFPIISGICLSLALTNLQNLRRFKQAKKDCTESSKCYIEASKSLTEIKEKYESLESEILNWGGDSRVENYAGILQAHYNYGYTIGLAEPDRFAKGKDFFEKVEHWQEKMISRKINNSIIKMSQI